MFLICDSSRYLHLPHQSIISNIIVTGYENTRDLAAHYMLGMICSGALSGAKIICCGCSNTAIPQKGGVMSTCKVHSVKLSVTEKGH